MESPEERAMGLQVRLAHDYLMAVKASRSDAWSYGLMSVTFLSVAFVMGPWSPGGAFAGVVLVLLAIMFQVLLANNFRAWMPTCDEEGYQPARRPYLDSLRGRPPKRRLWTEVRSAEIERYPDDFGVSGLRSKPSALLIKESDGTATALYRTRYPEVFDRFLAALVARGLVPGIVGGDAAARADAAGQR